MFKKTYPGLLLLFTGFMLGAIFYHFIQPREFEPPLKSSESQVASDIILKNDKAFSEIVNSVFPAVVNLSTVKVRKQSPSYSDDPFLELFNDFFSPYGNFDLQKRYWDQNLGSGLVVSENGYIITNNHVVSGADKINVTLYDKRIFKGKVMGSDPKTDIAVVKIDSKDLRTIPWGDSDSLQVGEVVLAVGNPFGLNHTVTMGIISAVGRADVGIADYEDFIQTDAAINPGNSGGPLVDSRGNLIGINTAIFSKSGGYQGIGFAVPGNMARRVMEQLINSGRVIRGWLGVTVQELTPELAKRFGHESAEGALVGEVLQKSPAFKSGIKRGDIILEFGGKKVSSPSALKNMAATSRPGMKVPVKLLRTGKKLRKIVTVGELSSELDEPAHKNEETIHEDVYSGLNIIPLTGDIARQLNLKGDVQGVVVAGVLEGSPTHEAGLKRGDVILEINGRRVKNLEDFQDIVSQTRPDDTVLMYVNRGGRKYYLTVVVS
jgi:serine protease Do